MPAACARPIPKDEASGAPLCALWMGSLGLYKLRAATSFSASTVLKLLLIWLLVDAQARVFAHPIYASAVPAWHRHHARAAASRAADRERADQRAGRLRLRLLASWHALQAAKLRKILSRVASFTSPGYSPLADPGLAETGEAGPSRTEARSSGAEGGGEGAGAASRLADTAGELAALGFSPAKAERALVRACGNRRRLERDGVTENELLAALAQLIADYGREEDGTGLAAEEATEDEAERESDEAAVEAGQVEYGGEVGYEESAAADAPHYTAALDPSASAVVPAASREDNRRAPTSGAVSAAPSAAAGARGSVDSSSAPSRSVLAAARAPVVRVWRSCVRRLRRCLMAACDPTLLHSFSPRGGEAEGGMQAAGRRETRCRKPLLELVLVVLMSHTLELL